MFLSHCCTIGNTLHYSESKISKNKVLALARRIRLDYNFQSCVLLCCKTEENIKRARHLERKSAQRNSEATGNVAS